MNPILLRLRRLSLLGSIAALAVASVTSALAMVALLLHAKEPGTLTMAAYTLGVFILAVTLLLFQLRRLKAQRSNFR